MFRKGSGCSSHREGPGRLHSGGKLWSRGARGLGQGHCARTLREWGLFMGFSPSAPSRTWVVRSGLPGHSMSFADSCLPSERRSLGAPPLCRPRGLAGSGALGLFAEGEGRVSVDCHGRWLPSWVRRKHPAQAPVFLPAGPRFSRTEKFSRTPERPVVSLSLSGTLCHCD